MRLVDDEQPDALGEQRQHRVAELRVVEPLGADQQQVDRVVGEQRADLLPRVAVRRVDRVRADPEPLGRGDLVAHQRQQRRDDQRRARRRARAAARWRGSRPPTCPSPCAARTARGRARRRGRAPPRAGAGGTRRPARRARAAARWRGPRRWRSASEDSRTPRRRVSPPGRRPAGVRPGSGQSQPSCGSGFIPREIRATNRRWRARRRRRLHRAAVMRAAPEPEDVHAAPRDPRRTRSRGSSTAPTRPRRRAGSRPPGPGSRVRHVDEARALVVPRVRQDPVLRVEVVRRAVDRVVDERALLLVRVPRPDRLQAERLRLGRAPGLAAVGALERGDPELAEPVAVRRRIGLLGRQDQLRRVIAVAPIAARRGARSPPGGTRCA